MSTWTLIDTAMAIIKRDHLCPQCGAPMRGIGHDEPWAAKACALAKNQGIPGVDFRPHGQRNGMKCECDLCTLYDAEWIA